LKGTNIIKTKYSWFSDNFYFLKFVFFDFFWSIKFRKKKDVLSFCIKNEFKFIFFLGGPYKFSHDLATYISSSMNIPLFFYLTDDYLFSLNLKNSLFKLLFFNRVKSFYQRTIDQSNQCFVIGETMAKVYSDNFNVNFKVLINNGKLELTLNSRNAPPLVISDDYKLMLKEYEGGKKQDKSQKEAVFFIKQKIDSAKWFIEMILQRQQTLLLTMNAILEYQSAFFLSGDTTSLRPMILKDIAEKTNLDVSTVSRVANSKYVQTEFGTYRLKFLFSESMQTDAGEEVSTREVKRILSDIIEAENKKNPFSDEILTDMLQEKGYNIARRTVAKYREQLNIPVARLRKEI
jgi:hypothetical protein